MKTVLLIIGLLFISNINAQIKNNVSTETWVLVCDDSTKQVITTVEPGYHTTTIYILKEFSSSEELENYIKQNNLIKKEN
jgi:hypothetical protein